MQHGAVSIFEITKPEGSASSSLETVRPTESVTSALEVGTEVSKATTLKETRTLSPQEVGDQCLKTAPEWLYLADIDGMATQQVWIFFVTQKPKSRSGVQVGVGIFDGW